MKNVLLLCCSLPLFQISFAQNKFELSPSAEDHFEVTLDPIIVIAYKVPLIDRCIGSSGIIKKVTETQEPVLEATLDSVFVVAGASKITMCYLTTCCLTTMPEKQIPAPASPAVPDAPAATFVPALNIWPNPASEMLHVELAEAADELWLTDLQGRRLLQLASLRPGRHILQIAHLTPGNYFISILKEKEVITKTIVVQNSY